MWPALGQRHRVFIQIHVNADKFCEIFGWVAVSCTGIPHGGLVPGHGWHQVNLSLVTGIKPHHQ